MTTKTVICAAAFFFLSACQHDARIVPVVPNQSEAEIESCIRTALKLDEGRWAYMGTIAQVRGRFRTYEAISVHASAGPDMWSSKAFGGDFGGEEESAELHYNKLVGTSLIPMQDGELNEAEAVKYLSCVGPDQEGRYEAIMEYKIPNGDGTYVTAKNLTWYSEHGSYYAEDIYTADGYVNSRRSGVNTPAPK